MESGTFRESASAEEEVSVKNAETSTILDRGPSRR
jgi:hypothetical protein